MALRQRCSQPKWMVTADTSRLFQRSCRVTLMDFHLDRYTYQARLLPALIAFTPVGFAIAVWFPGEAATWNWLGTLFISLGLAALLSQLGRDRGKRKESWLFQQWGGIPTTRMLSHRVSKLNSLTLKRY